MPETKKTTSSKKTTTKTTVKTKSAKVVEETVVNKINEYKLNSEAQVVAILYKKPDEFIGLNLVEDDFSTTMWRDYFTVAKELIIVEKKAVLDEVVVGMYLDKHKDLQERYNSYGGFATILSASAYVKEKNLNAYIQDIHKWNAVIKLQQKGFPVVSRLNDYADMCAEDIYNEYNVWLNDIFVNIENDVKSYDITDGIDELIDKLDKGVAVGMPYYNLPILTNETGGQYNGSVTLVGGLSNVGKSTFIRETTIGSVWKYKEPIVIMVNEDSLSKWQRELIVQIANNVLHFDLQKHVLRNGHFTSEVRNIIEKAIAWLKEQTKNHLITIIPFKKFSTSTAVKTIRKYAGMGITKFLLDTFKMDAGKVSENSWLELQQNMVEIFDTVKEEALNVHIAVTFQLSKSSSKQRFYTQDNIGMAKNIIDPVSTCIMVRNLFPDEYEGERHALYVYQFTGERKKTKTKVKLNPNKHYQIIFIIKNREGSANEFQIVVEHDLSRDILKEVGITNVPVDF